MERGQPQISTPTTDNLDPSAGQIALSVVIVNYNVREFLEQALRSVFSAAENVETEVFVVDNNSADGSVEMIREDFPSVQLISNEVNIGFGKANNLAINKARGRYILILNPDTIVQEDTLSAMVAFMDSHEDAGAVGCQILNPDGSFAPESRRAFPTPEIAFYRMFGLSRLFPQSPRFGRYNMTYLPRDQTAEVDALSGSCMMLRAEALHGSNGKMGAGLFDEAFFMYGEDLDLCYRIQQAGWKIYYHPETRIIHYKGESTKKGDLRYVRLFYGAMLLFIEKHLDPSRSRLLSVMLRAGIVARAGLSLFKSSISSLYAPFLDFSLVYVTVTLLGLTRFMWDSATISTLFFFTVSPVYGLGTVLGIWLAGGYRRRPARPLKPVFWGIFIGFVTVATASFFIPAIAFSRIVVALSLPFSAVWLALWRGVFNAHRAVPRRAILVGDAEETVRLKGLLDTHPRPPFLLEGYVTETDHVESHAENGPIRVGRLSQLRDLIRLRGIHDVVFAARSISNQAIFQTMRELQDMNVQYRMLHQGSEHVIGKASISRLSIGATLADLPEVVELRSRKARRLFDVSVAVVAVFLAPLSPILLPLAGLPVASTLRKLKWIPSILKGKASWVGCAPRDLDRIPASWNLPLGVFAITNTLRTSELDTEDLLRAYWFYETHQSPGLDADIMIRALRDERACD